MVECLASLRVTGSNLVVAMVVECCVIAREMVGGTRCIVEGSYNRGMPERVDSLCDSLGFRVVDTGVVEDTE